MQVRILPSEQILTEIMNRIFAKLNSSEKAIAFCRREDAHLVMTKLNDKYGGSWVVVDQLKYNEGIKFDDNLIYKGYHGKDERYVNEVINVF